MNLDSVQGKLMRRRVAPCPLYAALTFCRLVEPVKDLVYVVQAVDGRLLPSLSKRGGDAFNVKSEPRGVLPAASVRAVAPLHRFRVRATSIGPLEDPLHRALLFVAGAFTDRFEAASGKHAGLRSLALLALPPPLDPRLQEIYDLHDLWLQELGFDASIVPEGLSPESGADFEHNPPDGQV